jgi:hypothetical protein
MSGTPKTAKTPQVKVNGLIVRKVDVATGLGCSSNL